jgi:hypothetical protein
MKVQCIHKQGMPVPDDVIALGNTQATAWDVTFGREYIVYAILLRQNVIKYLILDTNSPWPNWSPAFLFRIVDRELPSGWFFHNGDPAIPVDAIWGYEELVQPGAQHFIDLIEREGDALEVFSRRRAEIEERA